MGIRSLEICLFLQWGDRLYTSESDVYRRQILSSKVDHGVVRVKAQTYQCEFACVRIRVIGFHAGFRLTTIWRWKRETSHIQRWFSRSCSPSSRLSSRAYSLSRWCVLNLKVKIHGRPTCESNLY